MMTYNEAFVLASAPYVESYPVDWSADKFMTEFMKAAAGGSSLDECDIVIEDVWCDYETATILDNIKLDADRLIDVYNYGRTGVASGQLQKLGLKSYNYVVPTAAAPVPTPAPLSETVSPATTPENNKPLKKVDPYARFR